MYHPLTIHRSVVTRFAVCTTKGGAGQGHYKRCYCSIPGSMEGASTTEGMHDVKKVGQIDGRNPRAHISI